MTTLTNNIELAKEYLEIEEIKEVLVKHASLTTAGVEKAEELGLTNTQLTDLSLALKQAPTVAGRMEAVKSVSEKLHELLLANIESKLLDILNVHSREKLESEYAGWYVGYLIGGTQDKDTQRKKLANKFKRKVVEQVNDVDELLSILDI